MGNAQFRRPQSRASSVASTPRRRSNSLIPPSADRRAASLDEDNQDMGKRSAMVTADDRIKRKVKAFRSSTNVASETSNGGSGANSAGRPVVRDKYALTTAQRDLIKGNWEPNRDRRHDIARRIYGRAFNKRPDVREVYEGIGLQVWADEAKKFAEFMNAVIQNVDDLCIVERLSLDLGRRHGDWRAQGFKPEFWVAFAESMTKECVYLDLAVHPAGEVLEAWSKLIGLIFGWARDGYYEKVRLQRRLSRKTITKSTSVSSPSLSNSSRSNSTDDQQHQPAIGSILNVLATPTLPTIDGSYGTPPAAV